MVFSMKVTDIEVRDKALLKRLERAEIAPLRKAALLVEREAKTSMRKGGRSKGPRGGKSRKASTPPAPPHVQSGIGRGSISTAFVRRPDGSMTALVGPTNVAFYMGHIHERGGEFGGRNYPARPFMAPALANVQNQFPALFRSIF